ncbi:angiotensin-converting enzyme-like [Strongylocentrotus purpuratus]|uniref:Angiotensin-converting enzyme n=1 Tax=Strongylocentrotus purpuratus TaxID=7668 RepID=A0A7M7T2S6_STRPU|nr:angiotensin-converting enzyme-like [Strongylocentrotus purpuratus]
MATSMDWDELVWAWEGFRDAVGIPNKPLFARYVDIANEGARANGYDDLGDSWRSAYSDDLENQVYELYNAILPLYKQLHAYVRRRLNGVYGSEHVPLTGNLPANVLGDMWGRFWTNIYPHVVPYPDLPNIDVSDEMVRQNYTVDRIARMADEFFSSMGLFPVNDAFWENSMLERPDDGRDVVCHASAWDFYNRVDFRIKMCTEVNMEYFLILHHELGHIQYDMNYKHQPVSFRDGANIAFQEAIGEVMSQSVATPKHLKEVGLFDGEDDPIEGEYN